MYRYFWFTLDKISTFIDASSLRSSQRQCYLLHYGSMESFSLVEPVETSVQEEHILLGLSRATALLRSDGSEAILLDHTLEIDYMKVLHTSVYSML